MRSFFAALSAALFPLATHAVELEIPIQCELNKTCFIQSYVDQDASATATDYQCGSLTYNDHKGVDFRVADELSSKPVYVLAAAPGTVRGGRDGMEDISVKKIDIKTIANRECGNGVAIAHDGGIETQYCHMKKGSLRVKAGQAVKTGDVLGEVGMSGQTEFRHLHFQINTKEGILDPFTGVKMGDGCSARATPLWSKAALTKLAYKPSGVIGSGFTTIAPEGKAMEVVPADKDIAKDAPSMIFWAKVIGLQTNDTLTLKMKAPDGSILAENTTPFDRNMAQYFMFIGKKLKTETWTDGVYTGEITLTRKGEQVISAEKTVRVIK